MSPYSNNYCDFQRFLLFQNKARNAGRFRKNAGNKPKCGISRTIAGRLTPMHMTYGNAKIKSKYKMKEGDGKVTDIKHDDEVEKDLGVLFDTKLSFRQHIGSCTVKFKVNRMIGLTRRTFHYMDQQVFRLLFTSLMRPHMDYADCISILESTS